MMAHSAPSIFATCHQSLPPLLPFTRHARSVRKRLRATKEAAGNLTGVHESLTLLRFPDSCAEEDLSDVVDRVWSLQYVAPGPVCGSAGPLRPLPAAGAPPPAPFTHAVLFRYGSRRNLDAFMSNLKVKGMLGITAAKVAEGIATLCFEGAVPSELEAIFRRGPEWGEGHELVLALQAQPGSAEGEAAEFLALTQQLATCSAYGAVQASSGPCFSLLQHHAAGGDPDEQQQLEAMQEPDVVLLARFQALDQLNEFVGCPPVAAVLEGDERAPLRAVWAGVLEVAPAANSSSGAQRGSGGGGAVF